MSANPTIECLFIGGTAEGNRLPANPSDRVYHLPSQAPVINDPEALDDGDPRPETMTVEEIYLPITVTHANGVETVLALNALSDEAIHVLLVKHFGDEVSFTR